MNENLARELRADTPRSLCGGPKLPSSSLGLYVMTQKGLTVLRAILSKFGADCLAFVVSARDKKLQFDAFDEIKSLCSANSVPFFLRRQEFQISATYVMAVSWRWLLNLPDGSRLIVFHDSLLPKYRGFAPLVNALIKGESRIGVSAIWGAGEFDRGPILGQRGVAVEYPIKIQQAIELVSCEYAALACQVAENLANDALLAREQVDSEATYSLWRDEDDYLIDWSQHSSTICRFVDAVGYPYQGALTRAGDVHYRIHDCRVVPDVSVENRRGGKVLFVSEGKPLVVCGGGLLEIVSMTFDATGKNALPLASFRTRFR